MLLLPNFLIRTEQLTDLEVGKGTEMFRCCRVLRKFRGNGSKWGGGEINGASSLECGEGDRSETHAVDQNVDTEGIAETGEEIGN